MFEYRSLLGGVPRQIQWRVLLTITNDLLFLRQLVYNLDGIGNNQYRPDGCKTTCRRR